VIYSVSAGAESQQSTHPTVATKLGIPAHDFNLAILI
jgi:hypothetical protein